MVVNALALKPVVILGNKMFRQHVPIFMMHRFNCSELGIDGHEISLLRFALEFMRKHKFNFVSVDDVAQAMKNNELLPERSVAFTLDDGYWDQVEAAGEIFAHFDCPATYFVTTGFINGDLWLWDVKIRYLLEEAESHKLEKLAVLFPHLNIIGKDDSAIATKIIFDLTSSSIADIEKTIAVIAAELGVDVPKNAPEKYRATTWQRLKDMESMGLKIGAHTYSHPLLSQENHEKSKAEIRRSKEELASHINRPSNVFCYPVGRTQDFTEREERYVKELGFVGAVSSVPSVAKLQDQGSVYSIPRFGFPDNKSDIIQYSTWIESLKAKLRSP